MSLEIIGYLCALIVGLSMGMLGAGGAILTIPIMVYLFQVEPVLATVYSLFIVGFTAFTGSINYVRQKLINLSSSLLFAVPSVIIMFLMRKLVVPAIPAEFDIAGIHILKGTFILGFFSVVLLFSSATMILGGVKKEAQKKELNNKEKVTLILSGVGTGIITGMIGAGGGFIIIPALVLLAKMPMKEAVGTSLIIITINSLTGFAGDLTGNYDINWFLMISFLVVSIVGILIGSALVKKVAAAKLKKAFGWFILAMGVYIFIKEIFLK